MRQRRGCDKRCDVGTSLGAATRPSTTWPACGILSFEGGFNTTAAYNHYSFYKSAQLRIHAHPPGGQLECGSDADDDKRCDVGTSLGAATRPSTTWPACGILSFEGGFNTTAVSTNRPCIRSFATSMACWFDGPCGNTRGYGDIAVEPVTGSVALLVASPGCSPIGICWG